MLDLPNSVRIGFRTYKVLPLKEGAISEDGELLLGRHDWKGLIEINPYYNPEEVLCSFFHETLHGIIDVHNIDISKEDEEGYVKQLCGPLTAFFRDNPDVIKWILELCQKDTNEKTSKVL